MTEKPESFAWDFTAALRAWGWSSGLLWVERVCHCCAIIIDAHEPLRNVSMSCFHPVLLLSLVPQELWTDTESLCRSAVSHVTIRAHLPAVAQGFELVAKVVKVAVAAASGIPSQCEGKVWVHSRRRTFCFFCGGFSRTFGTFGAGQASPGVLFLLSLLFLHLYFLLLLLLSLPFVCCS